MLKSPNKQDNNEKNPFTADNSFICDNRNGVRRFGYPNQRRCSACNDFYGVYRAEIHHPHNALHFLQGAEMGVYHRRNRVDFNDTFLIIKKYSQYMKTKRYSKTAIQQNRYYEVPNIYAYLVESYTSNNLSQFNKIYKELSKDARKDFISYCFSEVHPQLIQEIIQRAITL